MLPAITVDNLGKRYALRHQHREQYASLRDAVTGLCSSVGHRLAHPLRHTIDRGRLTQDSTSEDFWALKNVSLAVKQGDRLGIIGRNGAGKSTLLKILSRITEPTTGSVRIKGRVACLLEVGTGFHPELTGRENIFLNGAILGMGRQEIRDKFDEIVGFSEIERFLDTPVKRYSSGMYVRLAFAVAAHLEPEILVVDEVLAVGDAQFQKKCLGKMADVGKEGRTVLFVSHNMAAIQSLCTTGILLNSGESAYQGTIAETIYHYNKLLAGAAKPDATAQHGVKITGIGIVPGADGPLSTASMIDVNIQLSTPYLLPRCYLNLVIEDSEGHMIIHTRTDLYDVYPSLEPGNHEISVHFDRICIRAGIYSLWFRLYCNSENIYELADSDRIMVEVTGPQVGGLVDVPCQWLLDGRKI